MAAASGLPRLGFLDLPAEIRIEIYQHLFQSAQIIVPATQLVAPALPPIVCSGGFQRHVLNTCWTIRNEALSYLVAATTLHICQPLEEATPIPPYYLQNIPRLIVSDVEAFSRQPFNADRLPGLQVLELRNITIWCKYHTESFFLDDELGSSMMCGLALNKIKWISPSLTKLVEDKQRAYRVRLFCQFIVGPTIRDTINTLIDIDGQTVLYKERGPKISNRDAWPRLLRAL